MLHIAYIYIYIAIVREIMRLFKHVKCSSQMLNTFEKTKKRNVIFYKDDNYV